jgi:hypothetical protein
LAITKRRSYSNNYILYTRSYLDAFDVAPIYAAAR